MALATVTRSTLGTREERIYVPEYTRDDFDDMRRVLGEAEANGFLRWRWLLDDGSYKVVVLTTTNGANE